MVQLPELLREDFKEHKEAVEFCKKNNLDYNLAELSKERIRRAIKLIKKDHPEFDGDLGFKVFKLDASNIKPWDPTFEDVQLSLEDSVENIKSDRSEEDVIYEILLKYGLDLTLPIEEKTIAGAKVYVGGAGALILCLSDNITTEVVEGIAKLKDDLNPEFMRVVFRDSGFKDDVIKTNAVQILKQQGIEDMRSI
jgi:adenine-specific DNA-methyltransferase